MPDKFVMKKSGTGFHWNLLASNGKVIATSEHYETRRAALAGIASVQKNAPGASTVDADDQPATKETAKRTLARPQRRAADRTTVTRTSHHSAPGWWGVPIGASQVRSCSGGGRRSHPGLLPERFGSAQ